MQIYQRNHYIILELYYVLYINTDICCQSQCYRDRLCWFPKSLDLMLQLPTESKAITSVDCRKWHLNITQIKEPEHEKDGK